MLTDDQKKGIMLAIETLLSVKCYNSDYDIIGGYMLKETEQGIYIKQSEAISALIEILRGDL